MARREASASRSRRIASGVGNGNLGCIFTFNGSCIGFGGADTCITHGFGNTDVFVSVGLCLTNLTETVLFGYALLWRR